MRSRDRVKMGSRDWINMRSRDRVTVWAGGVLLDALWVVRLLCRPKPLRGLYLRLMMRLVTKTRLFDEEYYLETNGDVTSSRQGALRHFVTFGDRDGRYPMPLFDPVYYRNQLGGMARPVNTLLHWSLVGRYLRLSPSPWFDTDYYLSCNKDVDRSGLDPLRHYLKHGGSEGRAPSDQFDPAWYLTRYPEVLESGINPLVHYILFGRAEGCKALPDDSGGPREPPGRALPTDAAWAALRGRSDARVARVDVVVPVYKGRGETLRCLYSVLCAASETPYELVVIDDAGPDPALAEDLRRVAGLGAFTLLVNAENQGFVRTVNRGMSLHGDRDVVLLNSDTEVYDGWLDRIHAAAMRGERVGTVTPLSNNATICSYPRFCHDNTYPLEISYRELDRMAARANAGFQVEAPTAVGFCMYLRRACLDEVGRFDAEAFGKGYGEENDFCQRAIRKGWRNVVAADVFVFHSGSVSFQGQRAKRVQAALEIIGRRYPNYDRDVQAFIRANPLLPARRRLDWERLKGTCRPKNLLIVSHNRGGGTERHVQEDLRRFQDQGIGVFLMRPKKGNPGLVDIGIPRVHSMPNLAPVAFGDIEALRQTCRDLCITEIHTHSLVDFVPEAPDLLIALKAGIGARLEINLHDYKVICPRINLVDGGGRYCGEPEAAACDRCLAEHGSDFGVGAIEAWRRMHERVLLSADQVNVPDLDVAERLGRYFPEVPFKVDPHEDQQMVQGQWRVPPLEPDAPLRIVVVGAISKIKGFDVVLACANDARQRGLPLAFQVMGYSHNDGRLMNAGVDITGRYRDDAAQEVLDGLRPHLVWLPALWPETYSYTLSLALSQGLPVAAFDIGAIARRLRALDWHRQLMPLDLAGQPQVVNDLFVEYRRDLLERQRLDAALARE